MSSKFQVSGKQITAARDLLGMKQVELAAAAGVTEATVVNLEKGHHTPRESTLDLIREALERRGIEFTNGDNPGVRLVKDKAIIPPS